MNLPQEIAIDLIKLIFSAVSLYLMLQLYIKHRQPELSHAAERRRSAIALFCILLVLAIKVTEDVISRESHVVDEAILLYIHEHSPAAMRGFWETVTLTGSSKFLVPLTLVSVAALVYYNRRFDALLLALSVIIASLVVYVVKMLINRTRPALWDTEWYWGSSFPSGHTLVVASFATAAFLITQRIWPRQKMKLLLLNLTWMLLVGYSRLVLGVHWPTDVLVALCVGIMIPLLLQVSMESRLKR